jgi:hypothetical protein
MEASIRVVVVWDTSTRNSTAYLSVTKFALG